MCDVNIENYNILEYQLAKVTSQRKIVMTKRFYVFNTMIETRRGATLTQNPNNKSTIL